MTKIDVQGMALDELKAIKRDVEKAIQGYEQRRRVEALAAVEAKAKELGFSLAELTGTQGKKGAIGSPPKYAHHENPSVTWTGRGRQPAWIKEGLEAGKSLDDFLIIKT